MSFLRRLLGRILALLIPLTITATVYLYLYPVFNGCAFPLPQSEPSQAETRSTPARLQQNPVVNTLLQHLQVSDSSARNPPAIFRLLVLADPQLEGDTSLPFPEYELIPRVHSHWRAVREALDDATTSTPLPLALLNPGVVSNITTGVWTFASEDVPRSLWAAQKRVDLLGNDFYLAHIYRTLFWWTRPTHTTVLGDLLGSQWITDEEFAQRGQRFWTRVFKGGERVDDHITATGAFEDDATESNHKATYLEPLGPNADPAWTRRIINVAGNHDIGYAGDINEARMERFEREFGRANWDIRFQHPPVSQNNASEHEKAIMPTIHLINLNSLVLDTPALSSELQTRTYSYLNDIINHRLYPVEDRSTFTLLLTHVPLHKEDGVCTDSPYFNFYDDDDEDGLDGVPRWLAGGLREQNHLSDHISAIGILQGLFGMTGDKDAPAGGHGRKGLILTGHDHTGCDILHFIESDVSKEGDGEIQNDKEAGSSSPQGWRWATKRYNGPTDHFGIEDSPSIREVTLRSMMGEFGGNAGLLSVWFDAAQGEWDYKITMCPAGVQHIWWAVHVLILVTSIGCLLWIVASLSSGQTQRKAQLRSDKVRMIGKGQGKEPL